MIPLNAPELGGRPVWLQDVALEANAMANRIASDLRLSLEASLRHLPDPKNKNQRSMQLNEFFTIMPRVVSHLVCLYGGPHAEIEKTVHEIVHDVFHKFRQDQEANAEKVKVPT